MVLCKNSDQTLLDRPFTRPARIVSAAVGALAAGFFGYAGSALAQPAAPAQTQESGELQEVTVTATRREESIIQVPISVTALSAGDLTQHNVQDFADYAKLIPNLSYAYSGFAVSNARGITIRGIQGADSTSLYIDDTPVPTSVDPRVLDIQRIEVLRGPQGTLFGASSMGGSIRMITNQPDTHNFSAQYTVQGGYTTRAGSPNGGLSGVVNFVAIPDKLAIRMVGYIEHDGGWFTRNYLNDPYNPANGGFVLSPLTFPYVGGTSHLDDQGRQNSGGASISARLDVTSNFSAVARVLYQMSKTIGIPSEVGVIANSTQDFSGHPVLIGNLPVRAFGFQSWIEDRWYLPSLDLNYTGRGFSLHSSTSYFERTNFAWESDAEGEAQVAARFEGLDASSFTGPNSLLQDHQWRNGGKNRRITEEDRITIDPIPVANLPVTVGGVLGYYWSRNYTGPSNYVVVGCNQTTCAYGDFIGAQAAGFHDYDLRDGSAYLVPNDHDWIVPPGVSYTTDSSWFGELNFKFFDHLTVTVGDRYFHLTTFNDGAFNYYGWTAGVASPALPGGFGPATPVLPNITENTGHSPKYSIAYEFNPDASAYISASRGFRPGNTNSANQLLPQFCNADMIALGINPATAGTTVPDYLWNYEVGTKFRLHSPDLILKAAIYQIDWKHIQQQVILNCSYNVGVNAGEAKSQGEELEISWNPVPGLALNAAGGYENAHTTVAGPGQQVGQPLFLVPRYTASGGFVYTFENTMAFPGSKTDGHLFVSGDYSYTGQRRSNNTSSSYSVTIPHYNWVTARAGMQFEKSELSINIDNVTNTHANLTDYIAQGWSMRIPSVIGGVPTPNFLVGKPRTYMLQYQHQL